MTNYVYKEAIETMHNIFDFMQSKNHTFAEFHSACYGIVKLASNFITDEEHDMLRNHWMLLDSKYRGD